MPTNGRIYPTYTEVFMIDLVNTLSALSRAPSPVGFEPIGSDALVELFSPHFDEWQKDAVGNHIFIRRCGREGAPKLMIDAHFDEVGLIVTKIEENGTLRFTNLGGVDRRILPAADVDIYGAEGTIYGVIASTPTHLLTAEERKKLEKIDNMYIDTGYTKKELEETLGVRVGTPIGFRPYVTELLSGRIAGRGFDDKACAAVALAAVCDAFERGGVRFDVYVCISAAEENGMSGAEKAAFRIKPDLALVLDVGFAEAPDTSASQGAFKLGSGFIASYSAVTDIKLTRRITRLADDLQIKNKISVEPNSTGTNGDDVVLVEAGIPTAVLGIPLRSMHTYSEVIDTADMKALVDIVSAIIRDPGMEEYSRV